LRALPGGRTAEASCRPWDRLRGNVQPGEPGEGERTSLGSRTLQHRAIPEERPSDLPRERSDIQGGWGALPTSSLAYDRPRRQARASVVPLLAECLSLPLGATLLPPYGSSGRATARSVAGRLPRFRRKPRAAQEPSRGAGRGVKPPCTARSECDRQSPSGEGGYYRAWHKRWCRGAHMTDQRGEGSGAGSAETGCGMRHKKRKRLTSKKLLLKCSRWVARSPKHEGSLRSA